VSFRSPFSRLVSYQLRRLGNKSVNCVGGDFVTVCSSLNATVVSWAQKARCFAERQRPKDIETFCVDRRLGALCASARVGSCVVWRMQRVCD
jgi:hypothetical protein